MHCSACQPTHFHSNETGRTKCLVPRLHVSWTEGKCFNVTPHVCTPNVLHIVLTCLQNESEHIPFCITFHFFLCSYRFTFPVTPHVGIGPFCKWDLFESLVAICKLGSPFCKMIISFCKMIVPFCKTGWPMCKMVEPMSSVLQNNWTVLQNN